MVHRGLVRAVVDAVDDEGGPRGNGREVLGRVVDGVGAPAADALAVPPGGGAVDGGAGGQAQLGGELAHPASGAVHEHDVVGGDLAEVVHGGPGGDAGEGGAGEHDVGHLLRRRDHARGGQHDVFGVEAAGVAHRRESEHPLPDLQVVDLVADGGDLAAALAAEHERKVVGAQLLGHAGGAVTDLVVDGVDARGEHPDQHVGGPGRGGRPVVDEVELFGTAEAVDLCGSHGGESAVSRAHTEARAPLARSVPHIERC